MSLKDDLLADMADIFDSKEISVTAVVTPAAGGPSWDLEGKMRSPYRAERLGSTDIGGQNHSFLCFTAAKSALRRNDTLTIDGADYRHIEPQDGNPTDGMSSLQLAPL
jgi:hypothetical protein